MKTLRIVKEYLVANVTSIEPIEYYNEYFQLILDYRDTDEFLKNNTELLESSDGQPLLFIKPLDTYIQYESNYSDELIGVYTTHSRINNTENIYRNDLNTNREKEIIEYLKENIDSLSELDEDISNKSFLDVLIDIYSNYYFSEGIHDSLRPFKFLAIDKDEDNLSFTLYFSELNSIVTVDSVYENSWVGVDSSKAIYYFSRPKTIFDITYMEDL